MFKKMLFIRTLRHLLFFESLEKAITDTSVLTLPDFTKPFVLEIDTCNIGIRVVLMQDENLWPF